MPSPEGFDITDPDQLKERAAQLELEEAFSGRVGIGVRNVPKQGRNTWVVVTMTDGKAEQCEIVELELDAKPEDDLDVRVGISATKDTWTALASGSTGFLELVNKERFYISGDAPFFIRHLDSFVTVMQHF